MESKEYLDKVLDHLVRNTKIDYEKEIITFPFSITYDTLLFSLPFHTFYHLVTRPTYSFEIYFKNTFGLTDDEIKYVFKQYRDNIKDKIENG